MKDYIDGKGVLVGRFTDLDCRLQIDKRETEAVREKILKEDGVKLYPEAKYKRGILTVYLVKEEDLSPLW